LDIAQSDALHLMKVEKVRAFLMFHIQKRQPVSMIGFKLNIKLKKGENLQYCFDRFTLKKT